MPNPQRDSGGWVTDLAQILSPDTEAKLNQIISELEHQKSLNLAGDHVNKAFDSAWKHLTGKKS